MSLEEVIRVAATDEASRYGDISLLEEGQGISSPSSSFFGGAWRMVGLMAWEGGEMLLVKGVWCH